jgi:sulfur transfer protein SufE
MRQPFTQRGQSTIEYALVAAGLAAALFVVEFKGQTAAQYLAAAVRAFFQNLSFYLSLP